jgi:hypothetical protein
VAVSTDYRIQTNSSGATDHVWLIAGTEKARLDDTGLAVVDDLTISDKIIHAGDSNTAIRFPAADTVTVETNGAERARINSSGNVGIGTSSPSSLLHLADAGHITVGTGTGTKIGTATTQKIGFYNATPVVQPTAVADATDAATVITQLNALLAKLRTLGIIAT